MINEICLKCVTDDWNVSIHGWIVLLCDYTVLEILTILHTLQISYISYARIYLTCRCWNICLVIVIPGRVSSYCYLNGKLKIRDDFHRHANMQMWYEKCIITLPSRCLLQVIWNCYHEHVGCNSSATWNTNVGLTSFKGSGHVKIVVCN